MTPIAGAAAQRFASAAEALVGVPFRLHGRDPAYGLDCVGLVHCALEAIGRKVPHIPPYGLRNSDYAFIEGIAGRAGFIEACGPVLTGNLVLTCPGPAQRHLLVRIERKCFVHAHAGLGRVVTAAEPLPWPILRQWRLIEEE